LLPGAIAHGARKRARDDFDNASGDSTPTTTESDCGILTGDGDSEPETQEEFVGGVGEAGDAVGRAAEGPPPQLGPGLYPPPEVGTLEGGLGARVSTPVADPALYHKGGGGDAAGPRRVEREPDALFVFDWDDTLLPSSWILRQGLRLDVGSDLSDAERDGLNMLAASAGRMLRIARRLGTVVLVTNAERGWIELSCQKFLPSLLPTIEGVRNISARSTYESDTCTSPLEWKVQAFEAEIRRAWGAGAWTESTRRRHVLSLGDSVHERAALMRATEALPSCRAKSLKFAERPDVGQLLRQHALVSDCLAQIVQHDGDLDLGISC